MKVFGHMFKSKAVQLGFVALALVQALPAQADDLKKSCRDYVQGFYNFYLVDSCKDNEKTPCDIRVFNNKKYSFSPELQRLLRADYAAQAKVSDEIVGLDFDPYMASQEAPKKYIADPAKPGRKANSYMVAVYDMTEGKRPARPAVTPELSYENGKWVFTNFHYGKGADGSDDNLIAALKGLAESRRHPPK